MLGVAHTSTEFLVYGLSQGMKSGCGIKLKGWYLGDDGHINVWDNGPTLGHVAGFKSQGGFYEINQLRIFVMVALANLPSQCVTHTHLGATLFPLMLAGPI